MGLIEIIGELISPGKIGSIDKTKRKKEKHIGTLIVKTILSIAIVTVIYYMIFGFTVHIIDFLLFITAIAIYSVVSYLILPKPDYSNLGWFGGVIDNPFKISDDINRMLVFLMILLIPGRLISNTVLSWFDLFRK